MDSSQQLLNQAATAIADKLGVAPSKVQIGAGDFESPHFHRREDKKKTNFVITVEDADATVNQPAAEKKLRAAFSELAPLKNRVQTRDEGEMGGEMYKEINEATKGTSFNQHYIESPIFASGKLAPGESIRDFAIQNVRSSAYGIDFIVYAPTTKEGGKESISKYLDSKFKSNLPAIKALLLKRAEKYLRENLAPHTPEEMAHLNDSYRKNLEHMGKSPAEVEKLVAESLAELKKREKTPEQFEQEMAKAKAQLEKLQFNIGMRDANYTAGVEVSIRSPEQAAAFEKAGYQEYNTPPNSDELRATNPLNSLHFEVAPGNPHPQLQKAISRSFLHAGENVEEMLNLIAGRHDMKVVLLKEMERIKKEMANDPEKLTRITGLAKKIEESDLFKIHHPETGEDKGQALPPITFNKPYQSNKLEARIQMDQEEVSKLIPELAALARNDVAKPKTNGTPDTKVGVMEYMLNSVGLGSGTEYAGKA